VIDWTVVNYFCSTRCESIYHAEFSIQRDWISVIIGSSHISRCFKEDTVSRGCIVSEICCVCIRRDYTRCCLSGRIHILLITIGAICNPRNHVCTVHTSTVSCCYVGVRYDVNNILNFIGTRQVGNLNLTSIRRIYDTRFIRLHQVVFLHLPSKLELKVIEYY
jgi:hypothetical protein